jgi:hypothetical protein
VPSILEQKMKRTLIFLGLLSIAGISSAQQVATRANLNSLLTASTTDDFEKYSIVAGGADTTDAISMDSTTVVNGQGPGLVNAGATYLNPGGSHIQWNGDQYFGINTKSILINGNDGAIEIDYANPTQAMGLDADNFQGFGYSGIMDVYSGATIVGSLNFSLSGAAGETTFLGWQNTGGITKVVVHSGNFGFSPIIDNHTYGTISTVPEPASICAIGFGALALLRRRRK